MKPLLATKAPRLDPDGSNAIREWKRAESHLTHDGQVEFHQRMQARIKAVQSKPDDNVKLLRKDRK